MILGSDATRPRSALARFAVLLLAAPFFLAPGNARAEEPAAETRTIARELAMQGATAFENEDYSTALDRFQRAASLYQAPSITLMEARTLVRLGRFVEALDRYEATQRMTLPPDAPEALTLAVADARREGQELRARTPWLKVVVQGTPPGLDPHVALDGKLLPGVLLNIERPIDPGSHEVQATVLGRPATRRVVTLGEGEHRVALLVFEAPEAAATPAAGAPEAATPSPVSAEKSGDSDLKTWGYVAGGAGLAALGVSAITGIVALNKKSTLDEVCHPGCPASAADEIDSFRLNRTLSYTTFAIGLVGVGAGGYILLSGSREGSHVAAGVSGTSAWLRGKF